MSIDAVEYLNAEYWLTVVCVDPIKVARLNVYMLACMLAFCLFSWRLKWPCILSSREVQIFSNVSR